VIRLDKEYERIERATEKFATCQEAGEMLSFHVDRKTNTKTILGYCAREGRRIDVEPSCRICLRWEKKKKRSKKLGAASARIKKGRERQKKKEEDRKKFRRPGLDYFKPNSP
jgi:hypothetical protein